MHRVSPSSLGNFPDTLQDLPGIRLDAGSAGQAFVAAQGAQVLSWQAADGVERLYLSPSTGGLTRDGREAAPIRGGAPVCFPQFSGRGPMMKHGFFRTLLWRRDQATHAALTMTLQDDHATRQVWPHAFDAQVSVSLEAGVLDIAFNIVNTGDVAFSFTTALHTYLRVDDIRQIELLGLQDVAYEDATDGCAVKTQKEARLFFPGEVDRVYLHPPGPVHVMQRGRTVLTVSQKGFCDTVVWNPGPDRARALADMPDDDWLKMLCIEAACAAAAVELAPGESWEGSQRLTIG